MAMNLPSSVETGIWRVLVFGLLDALDKFDETRQIKFETYAATRIRGRFLTVCAPWTGSRSVRSKIRMLEKQVYELTNELGRSPSDSEVAAALILLRALLRTVN